MKRYLIFVVSLILFSNAYAFDIRNINQLKIVSQASYKVNDTNLVDSDNAENILENVKNLNKALSEKEKEIQNNNKNRSQPKFKGGAEEIYSDLSSSVVFIGNRKNKKLEGIVSGLVIKHKGKRKIITN